MYVKRINAARELRNDNKCGSEYARHMAAREIST